RVDLQHAEGSGLQHLLEHDAAARVLAGGDGDGRDAAGDDGVTEHVVGARGLLDPGDVELLQPVHPLDGLGDVPVLVPAGAYADVGAGCLAGPAQAAHIVLDVAA